ncbi:MAG: HAD family hydrolase [bacterium]
MKLILFDIDGTLLLSGGAGLRALDRAFASLHGVRGASQGIHFAGRTDPAIVHDIFVARLDREPLAAEMTALLEAYVPLLEEEIAVSERFVVMPGVAALLESLSLRDDLLIGLVTGNVERAAGIKLARAGLARHFRYGGFGSDSPDRLELTRLGIARGERLAAEMSRDVSGVVVIGDTQNDVRAGRGAGAFTVAVATGGVAIDALAAESPDLVLRDLAGADEFIAAIDAIDSR